MLPFILCENRTGLFSKQLWREQTPWAGMGLWLILVAAAVAVQVAVVAEASQPRRYGGT